MIGPHVSREIAVAEQDVEVGRTPLSGPSREAESRLLSRIARGREINVEPCRSGSSQVGRLC